MKKSPSRSSKSEPNQTPVKESSYIVLNFAYDIHYILSPKDASVVLDCLSRSACMKRGYNSPEKLFDSPQDINVSYMSPKEYREIQLKQVIDVEEGDHA